jgi:S-adenosylmethionine synthetase
MPLSGNLCILRCTILYQCRENPHEFNTSSFTSNPSAKGIRTNCATGFRPISLLPKDDPRVTWRVKPLRPRRSTVVGEITTKRTAMSSLRAQHRREIGYTNPTSVLDALHGCAQHESCAVARINQECPGQAFRNTADSRARAPKDDVRFACTENRNSCPRRSCTRTRAPSATSPQSKQSLVSPTRRARSRSSIRHRPIRFDTVVVSHKRAGSRYEAIKECVIEEIVKPVLEPTGLSTETQVLHKPDGTIRGRGPSETRVSPVARL